MQNKIRTLKFVGIDGWSRTVYKILETGQLCKDINCGDGEPYLHTCDNDFDGEPGFPLDDDIEIIYETGRYTKWIKNI